MGLVLAAVLVTCCGGFFAASTPASADTLGGDAGALAVANVGKSAGYCAVHPTKNTLSGKQFATSCDGHLGNGKGEYWCADFGRWVWGHTGFVTDGLTAAAASFNAYGRKYSTYTKTPAVGNAVTFAYSSGGVAHHVGIITAVGTKTITVANGDWDGTGGSGESYFARTSRVVSITFGRSLATHGTYVPAYGMYVSHMVGWVISV